MKRNKGLVRRIGLKRRPQKPQGTKPYYEKGIALSSWTCENCKNPIAHSLQWQQYAAQAHILRKEIYPSVKLNMMNRLHLCPACHEDWDSSWSKAVAMPVFPVAIARFLKFGYLLTENEKLKLPACFYEALPNILYPQLDIH